MSWRSCYKNIVYKHENEKENVFVALTRDLKEHQLCSHLYIIHQIVTEKVFAIYTTNVTNTYKVVR